MFDSVSDQAVFRFAPSPNGLMHLGHAYSALLNQQMADDCGGRLLLRIEDIDTMRCSVANIRQMLDDLAWLGVEVEKPVRRQSDHFDDYRAALSALVEEDLVYRSWMSRSDLQRMVTAHEEQGLSWPRDPDGAPLFAGRDHERSEGDGPFCWRLDMQAALERAGTDLFWVETGSGPEGQTGQVPADIAQWGDVVLVRKDTPTSYHLSVVVDDALQSVTHVVRGQDLFAATGLHRLLQVLFGLPAPTYHHHGLIEADDGSKLSKSRADTSIKALREAGATPHDIRRMVGL